MTDDLVKQLRRGPLRDDYETAVTMSEAADRIEDLERIIREDTKLLCAYHKWCEMNGCAPSSSDLISARKALEGKDD